MYHENIIIYYRSFRIFLSSLFHRLISTLINFDVQNKTSPLCPCNQLLSFCFASYSTAWQLIYFLFKFNIMSYSHSFDFSRNIRTEEMSLERRGSRSVGDLMN
uniref:Uncharacterized protein n=1 Tax=Cacopsylla melanoneura TaxID=428564 RepID=A0A8D9E9T8_9HEMI